MQIKFPNSVEAEMILIGCMLSAQSQNDIACQMLCIEDFYNSAHKVIFGALQEMYVSGKAAEINLLILHLKNSNSLKDIPSIEYLHNCVAAAETSFEVEDYATIVQDKSISRKFITNLTAALADVQKPNIDVVKLISEFQEGLYTLVKNKAAADPISIKEIVLGSQTRGIKPLLQLQKERIQDRLENPDKKCNGISTGIDSLDLAIDGLKPGHLIFLGARPGVGKTTFSLSLVVDVAVLQKIPCVFFSLEMSAEQLALKMVCGYGNIEQRRISQCDPTALPEFQKACEVVSAAPLHIIDQANIGVKEIRMTLKKLIDTHQIKFAVIDYLQLLKGSDKFKNSDSRVNEVSEITRGLKILARELNIPILCLAQLNRGIESRADKRPLLSDLRESGSIEQDADEVLMLHRPDMYDPNDQPGKFEVLFRKNRFNPINAISLYFDTSRGNFKDFNDHQNELLDKLRGSDD